MFLKFQFIKHWLYILGLKCARELILGKVVHINDIRVGRGTTSPPSSNGHPALFLK